ncbi:DNA-binding response regulator [Kineobactrum sediminis]|uniref:DNA-binding response regulator n=1 Tax=Kineobactrum sediminis TaxID=1905677 RepID=A0A2N5Y249_9GAMM|nr:response regulator transcription factor [Kineobactrum sediminis]PLW82458.1 DNA-binding response regulator [Kineobactrum sediminis]
MNILLADDEKPLLHFLSRGLRAEGHECTALTELHEVIPFIRKNAPHILVLDRLFGSQDSLTIVEAIKALPNPPMILMLTALDEVGERVKGLQKGADDYLCKPFDFDELLARIAALRRRMGPQPATNGEDTIALGTLELVLAERTARLNGTEIALTKIEYELLLYLTENQQKVLSRERILNRVWKTHSDPQTNIVDVYISRLRRKLDGDPEIAIQTLRGNGYRLTLSPNVVG